LTNSIAATIRIRPLNEPRRNGISFSINPFVMNQFPP
jgi:hypothetical protein